jgi:hypothetical protein
LLLFALLAGAGLLQPRLEGDTQALLQGAEAFAACARTGTIPCPDAGHFPLFQHLIAWVARALGATGSLPRVFGALSGLSLAGLAWIGARRLTARPAALFWLALLASPLLWYARSTFNELPAALVILAFVVALEQGASVGIAVLSLLICLTKEINPPILLLTAAAVWLRAESPRPGRAPALGLAFGLGAGLAANACFNLLRVGSPFNLAVLQPVFQVPSFAQQGRFALALLFSPNGGLLFFWPVAAVLLAWTGWRAPRAEQGPRRLLPFLPLLPLLALIAGLSRWYSPMGWSAWGPRLLLPWLPAVLYLSLRAVPDDSFIAFAGAKRLARALVIACTAAIPQGLALADRDTFNRFFESSPTCPPGLTIQSDPVAYYACVNHALGWSPDHWLLLETMASVLEHPGLLAVVLVYGLVLASLLRAGFRREPSPN